MIYDENSGKVSLMIKAIGPGDEGEYTCTALNPYGEAICTVYISPEATKQVKKSRSGHKLHKSNSNKQVQLAQQQQQLQMQQQQQQYSQQQQEFSSTQNQQFSQQSSSVQQQSSSMQQFSQQSSSSVQQASMTQGNRRLLCMNSVFEILQKPFEYFKCFDFWIYRELIHVLVFDAVQTAIIIFFNSAIFPAATNDVSQYIFLKL